MGDHQYARNTECKQCNAPRPEDGLVQKGSSHAFKMGDWVCPSCGDHQFAKNEACKQCDAPKPDDVVTARGDMKEGDWLCPACGDHQYAKNTECRKCGEANPTGSDVAAAGKPKGKGKGGKAVRAI